MSLLGSRKSNYLFALYGSLGFIGLILAATVDSLGLFSILLYPAVFVLVMLVRDYRGTKVEGELRYIAVGAVFNIMAAVFGSVRLTQYHIGLAEEGNSDIEGAKAFVLGFAFIFLAIVVLNVVLQAGF